MTHDEIIELAKQAGINATADTLVSYYGFVDSFERFANLVAEKEREACAQLCDERALLSFDNSEAQLEAQDCAEEIRARGNE